MAAFGELAADQPVMPPATGAGIVLLGAIPGEVTILRPGRLLLDDHRDGGGETEAQDLHGAFLAHLLEDPVNSRACAASHHGSNRSMEFDDQLVRYFGTPDIGAITPATLQA